MHAKTSVGVTALLVLGAAGAALGAGAGQEAAVVFTKDVAPILQRSCQVCHRPNNMAPMSLMTYAEARPWARSIRNKRGAGGETTSSLPA